MNPTPRKTDEETQQAVADYLAKGKKVDHIPYGAFTENLEVKGGFYGRRKPKSQEQD